MVGADELLREAERGSGRGIKWGPAVAAVCTELESENSRLRHAFDRMQGDLVTLATKYRKVSKTASLIPQVRLTQSVICAATCQRFLVVVPVQYRVAVVKARAEVKALRQRVAEEAGARLELRMRLDELSTQAKQVRGCGQRTVPRCGRRGRA